MFLVQIFCGLSLIVTGCDDVDRTIMEQEERVSIRYPDARPASKIEDMISSVDMMPDIDTQPSVDMETNVDMLPSVDMAINTDMMLTVLNEPPVFQRVRPIIVDVGEEVSFRVSVIDEMTETLVYRLTRLPDGAQFSLNTLLFRWTPNVMQGGQDYLITFTASDGELSGSLEVQITVNPPCSDGLRQTPPCGYEQCQAGQWVMTLDPIAELCNGYDEDCDGLIDENPNDTLSTCCDESCHLRSYCVEEICTDLPDGRCNYNGDCAENEICEARNCVRNTGSSCQNPINFNQQSMTVSGLDSTSQIDHSDSGCLGADSNVSAREGAEVVFAYESFAPGTAIFNASVSVNGVFIPITLTVTTTCPLTDQAQSSCVENYSQNLMYDNLRLSFQTQLRQTYFVIIDTMGYALQNELARQGASLADVDFSLNMR
ncbi:MAG: hypothetical protein CMH49_10480 [Myxococcales bacterium]|nr:hypothetical protein [Myxococcales bacterium]